MHPPCMSETRTIHPLSLTPSGRGLKLHAWHEAVRFGEMDQVGASSDWSIVYEAIQR